MKITLQTILTETGQTRSQDIIIVNWWRNASHNLTRDKKNKKKWSVSVRFKSGMCFTYRIEKGNCGVHFSPLMKLIKWEQLNSHWEFRTCLFCFNDATAVPHSHLFFLFTACQFISSHIPKNPCSCR